MNLSRSLCHLHFPVMPGRLHAQNSTGQCVALIWFSGHHRNLPAVTTEPLGSKISCIWRKTDFFQNWEIASTLLTLHVYKTTSPFTILVPRWRDDWVMVTDTAGITETLAKQPPRPQTIRTIKITRVFKYQGKYYWSRTANSYIWQNSFQEENFVNWKA